MYKQVKFLIILVLILACGSSKNNIQTVEQSHFELGMKAFENRDYITAERELALEVEKNNRHVIALCTLGKIHLIWGRLNNAEDKFSNVIKIDPNNIDALIGLTKSKINKMDYRGARTYVNKIFNITERCAEGYYLSGLINLENNKLELAVHDFKRTLELNPNNVNAQLKLKDIQNIGKSIVIDGVEFTQDSKVTRANLAYLIAKKLNLKTLRKTSSVEINDIKNHYAETEIRLIAEQRIMEIHNNKFNPKAIITKRKLAKIGENLIIQSLKDESLQTAFLNTDSPFSDINSTVPEFNAIILVTSYGLMEGDDCGKFNPEQEVNLQDVLNFIEKFKQAFSY